MNLTPPRATHRIDYRPPDYLIDRIDLRIDLGEEVTIVRSRLGVRRNPAVGGEAPPLCLNGERLYLMSVARDGEPLGRDDYQLSATELILPPVKSGCALEIVTELKPQENLALEGLYKSSGNFCTQCEAEGFRKITYFLDRPDVMARFTTTIEADAVRFPVLLSNGNPVARGTNPNGRHWVRWEDPFPKPCYLFAMVAGDLAMVEDRFTTRSGRVVELGIFVEPGNQDQVGHAMRSLKRAMTWDEEVYGLEYDLDIFMIVAVGDFNMGAMENKGLNIFNSKFVLAKPETATDQDFIGIETVVAHEYFHNWTGNRVTCRDWFQLSLKEGLTVFRDQEFSADLNSRAVKRIHDVQRLRAAQFAEDASALAHPVRPDSYIEINNFYTPTIYEKGAEVIRMIRTLVGPEGFRRGIDLYFRRHDGKAVTCDDFVAAIADATGVDFDQFKLWYSQAGTPEVAVVGRYDPARLEYRLTVNQSCPPSPGQPDKQAMLIPLAVGLLGPDGHDLPLRLLGEAESAAATTRVLELRGAEQEFTFVGIGSVPIPSLLRGFSAPVKIKADRTDAELAFLMAHDSDGFNRWEAGQTLATNLLLKLVEHYRAGVPLELPPEFVAAYARLLDDADADRALAALALALPSENQLYQQMAEVDPDAVHIVREFVRRALARALRVRWRSAYHGCRGTGPFSIDGAAIGRRALRNLSLAYLMSVEDDEAVGLCLAQYQEAATMTETIAALALLAASTAPERDDALDQFYQRWRDDPLVVNKWLALQALSPRFDTLDQVKALIGHRGFERFNPNKIYALIGTFCTANLVRFHDAGGAGYQFLADQVLALDNVNAQVAARLAGPFSRWRRFDPARGALLQAQLTRLVETPGLSPDVYEIASKSLAAVS